MGTRFWIKVFIGMLDDPKMARLPNHLWRRSVELSLLAGREGNDGALPPVEEMAWILRLPEGKVLEDLQGLEEAGVVHFSEPAKWIVTDFAKQQSAVPMEERVRQFRERRDAASGQPAVSGHFVTNRYKRGNEGGGEDSNSTSDSESDSLMEAEEKTAPSALPGTYPAGHTSPIFPQSTGAGKDKNGGGRAEAGDDTLCPSGTYPDGHTSPIFPQSAGAGKDKNGGVRAEAAADHMRPLGAEPISKCGNGGGSAGEARLPRTPGEAMDDPDIQVFEAVTGGRIPGISQYGAVIEAVRLLREREKLEEAELRETLIPYWLAWSSRKRQDGRPYDPGNITWLVEWALNGSIPWQGTLPGGKKSPENPRPAIASPEETRRMLNEKDKILKEAVPMPEEVRAKLRGLASKMGGKEDP